MQNNTFKRISKISFLLALISLIILFAASCGCEEQFTGEVLSKEELYENVHSDTKPKESVMRHLYEWGFPRFNTNKFGSVESLINSNYYEALPGRLAHATECADMFINEYYDSIDLSDTTAVTDALLKCYMKSIGDAYSVYRVPPEQNNFVENITGGKSFVGIGVQIRKTDEGFPYVNAVYRNSGAEAAGMHPCDIIVAVDDIEANSSNYNLLSNALRGESGTTVNVTVLRNGKRLDLSIERKGLSERSVTYYYDKTTGFAYVSITSFTKNTGKEFKETIDELERLGMRGVVYDLRSNTGGVLTSVKECVSYLVEDGLPFISYNKYNSEKDVEYTLADSHELDIPTVVLMNELTASAAEIFVAALRDYRDVSALGSAIGDVVLMGKKTYGKGIMQSTYALGDGSSVTFTSYYYNPPSGVNYHGIGIVPDSGYEMDWSITVENGDTQLNRAYRVLSEYFADAAA